MKRWILAVAVLGVFAGPAHAQSRIDIYGRVDAAMRRQTNATTPSDLGTPAGTRTGMESSWSNLNRIGFKGVEDLGGGLDAHFNLVAGFLGDTGSLDNAAGRLFNYTSTMGLAGAWGSIDVGRQYSAGFKTMALYDALGGRYPAINLTAAMGPGGVNPACRPLTGGYCGRFNNNIQYTGVFGGLTLRADYVLGEVPGNTGLDRAGAIGANYTDGPMMVGGAYTRVKVGTAVAPNSPVRPGYPGIALGAGKASVTVGGTYTRGGWRLALGYARDTAETIGTDTTITGGWAGLTYNFTPAFSLTGAYYRARLSTATLPVFRPDGKERGEVAVLEMRYALSRRTALYAEYDVAEWSNGANFALKNDAASNGLGVRQNGLSIGISHLF